MLQAELAPLEAWIEVTEAYLQARRRARVRDADGDGVRAGCVWIERAPRPTGRDGERANGGTDDDANERRNERASASASESEGDAIDDARGRRRRDDGESGD